MPWLRTGARWGRPGAVLGRLFATSASCNGSGQVPDGGGRGTVLARLLATSASRNGSGQVLGGVRASRLVNTPFARLVELICDHDQPLLAPRTVVVLAFEQLDGHLRILAR